MRKLLVLASALLVTLWLASPAGAGAVSVTSASAVSPDYVSSEPSAGEQVHRAPDRVSVTFSEPIDPSSDMRVEDHCGRIVDDGEVTISTNEMSVGLNEKPAGTYHVIYLAKGFGGITGQEQGSFEFSAHAGPSCGPGSDDHDRHDDDDDDEGKHDDHGDDDGRDHRDDHDDNKHDSRNHSGGSHSDMSGGSHSGGSHSSGDHPSGGSHSGGRHSGGKHGGGKHKGHSNGDQDQSLASGPNTDIVPPDGRAALIALSLSMVVGILGGWVLRMSAQR